MSPDDLNPSILNLNALIPPLGSEDRMLRPSTIGAFVRTGKCQRLLRFGMYRNDISDAVAEALKVNLEEFPATMSQAGRRWELGICEQLEMSGWVTRTFDESESPDFGQILRTALPGSKIALVQPTISGRIGSWPIHKATPDLLLFTTDGTGTHHLMVVDMKASRVVALEHRLQVAMYALLLRDLVPGIPVEQAILHRAPLTPIDMWPPQVRIDHDAAQDLLGFETGGCLSIADEADVYERQIERMIAVPGNLLDRVAGTPFSELFFHVEPKCDTCRFNPVCIKSAAESDDLSLIPNLTAIRKAQLVSKSVRNVTTLADLAETAPDRYQELLSQPGIGVHLDEIVSAATNLQASMHGERTSTWREHAHTSGLPAISAGTNPNLLQILIDLQQDGGSGRIYLASAKLTAHANGLPVRNGTRAIQHLAARPVESAEAESELIQAWIRDLMGAIVELTRNRAGDGVPIHLYVWDDSQIRLLADLINRQGETIFALDAIPNLLTQQASFAATHISVLRHEVRNQRQFPQLCQSLQTIAPHFGFRWSDHARSTFRVRLFDSVAADIDPTRDPTVLYRPARSRFRSSLPTEYAQIVWDDLAPNPKEEDQAGRPSRTLALFGKPTLDDIRTFQSERLTAMITVRDALRTNAALVKESFRLNTLTRVGLSRRRPIDAIAAFATLERHAELADWRADRSGRPASRFLSGDSIPVRFFEADQSDDVMARIHHCREQDSKVRATGKRRADLSAPEKKDLKWSLDGETLRLRIDTELLPIPLDQYLARFPAPTNMRAVISPMWSPVRAEDETGRRYPAPVWRLLRGMATDVSPGDSPEYLNATFRNRGWLRPGYGFDALAFVPADGETCVLDDRPDSETGSRQDVVIQAIKDDLPHAGYHWLATSESVGGREWPLSAVAAQRKFMAGLDAFAEAIPGAMTWEEEKRRYIGEGGNRMMTLVQGPPGTGKSTTSGMAVWARIQAGLAADIPMRVGLACKTHKATDVLLEAVADARDRLRDYQRADEALFAQYFDDRIFQVPLQRFASRDSTRFPPPEGKTASERIDTLEQLPYLVCAATSNGLGRLIGKQWQDDRTIWDLVVLDEASQISIPEYLVATTGLKPNGAMIVVGDHRQMPPIVHTIDPDDPTLVIDPFPVYRSLFDLIRMRDDPAIASIKFSRSFRIHRDVAEFLRRAIYVRDGIDFHSERREVLAAPASGAIDIGTAVASSESAIVLVRHDEASSQQQNDLEVELALAVVTAVGQQHPEASVGIVVPHRAQRAALAERILAATGNAELAKSVDTVERFQGDERDVIIFTATESDPTYLQAAGGFLFDPRRFNVAISRARQKLIVVASRELFASLPEDIVALQNAEIWHILARDVCTMPVWSGIVAGYNIEISGSIRADNPPIDPA